MRKNAQFLRKSTESALSLQLMPAVPSPIERIGYHNLECAARLTETTASTPDCC